MRRLGSAASLALLAVLVSPIARADEQVIAPGTGLQSAVVVDTGVMTTASDGTFQLARPVTGQEALAAVNKLVELSGRPSR